MQDYGSQQQCIDHHYVCVSFIFHTETMERNCERSVSRVESYATLQKGEITLKYTLEVCNIKLVIVFFN